MKQSVRFVFMERLPGFRDFYPEPLPHADVWSADARQYVFDTWRSVCRRHGFREYDGPPLEPLELFTTKSGDEIVGQLYNFLDKGERSVALRPEMTPTLARMAAAHARSYKKPIKWFALPQLFRYERQQKGRLREHFQLNADILGETDPAADAELMTLLIEVLRAFGLTEEDFVLRLSSRNAWQDFFSRRCSDHSRAYEFYQVVDKLEREMPDVSRKKLDALGLSYDEVQQFIRDGEPTAELQVILNNLRARGLAEFVKVDYRVVRGLAYYTGPVFEAFDRKGEFRAIAGGGRYDNLVKLISGGKVNLAALGFGMGDVVLMELLKARGLAPGFDAGVDAYFLVEEEELRDQSLGVLQQLRRDGLSVDYPMTPTKPDRQFKRALELGARFAVKLDPGNTLQPGQPMMRIKCLRTRREQTVTLEEARCALRPPQET